MTRNFNTHGFSICNNITYEKVNIKITLQTGSPDHREFNKRIIWQSEDFSVNAVLVSIKHSEVVNFFQRARAVWIEAEISAIFIWIMATASLYKKNWKIKIVLQWTCIPFLGLLSCTDYYGSSYPSLYNPCSDCECMPKVVFGVTPSEKISWNI